MENNKHTQIPLKKIPAFTVLKNGSILKNIFLIRKQSAVDNSPQNQDSGEEILFVGRHPHCHVTLEHPSISRHHLRIHSNPSSQTLSVVDLSSVHGTWVSGRKIEPRVHVKLKEGDTVRLGVSSRVYELHWVPRSQAYHVDEHFVPAVSMIKEESDQIVEEKHEEYSSNEDPECSDLSSSNKIHDSPLDPLTSSAHDYFGSDTEVEHSGPLTSNENDDIFASGSIRASPLVSETTSATQVSDNLNGLEDQLMSNGSKSSCNDTEVEHIGPLTGNQSDDIFASVSTQAPLVSETTSATQVSDGLNGLEDQLMSNGSKSSCNDTELENSGTLTGNQSDDIFTSVSTQAPLVSETTSATQVSDDLNGLEDQLTSNGSRSSCNDTELENSGTLTGNQSDDIFTSVSTQAPLVSETTSATLVSDNLNGSEDQLVLNCSKSSCDDTEVEHSCPLKTGNGNGELFTTVCIQAPLVASEDASEKDISDCLNKSEDQLMLNCSKSSCDDTEVKYSSPWKAGNGNGELAVFIQAPLLVSETTSATQVSDNLDNIEDQLVPNSSNSSCDDTEVEHSNPSKTGNENGELFTTVCIQAPLVASEAISETEVSDCLNKSEDKLNWLRDNLSNEFDHISHEKDETSDLFNAIETHENDDSNENIARSSEIDIGYEDQQQTDNGSDGIREVGCEFEQVNQMRMMEESATKVLYDGVDMSVHIESVDHETVKKESVFVLLPDVAEMNDKTFAPDISKGKEILTNLPTVQKLSASMKLFDSLDGKELEFYTPNKENKNPNASSGKSLSKKGVHTEQEVDQCVNGEEVLTFSSEKESKSVQKTVKSSNNFTKKRWTMVVDTNSLLDPKSLKHLKLLEGIKETWLVVPNIVVRELMDIRSQDGFFNRDSKKASIALKWIDECMTSTRWWIHMNDDETAHLSTAVPNVLAIALHLQEQITDQKIIILSDNLTLKIKAMAEGIMCEAAEEFRESLVNPFSDRFLWVGSSARGLTWSCVDDHDDIVRRKYHRFGCNGSQRFKGLKLLARAKQPVN